MAIGDTMSGSTFVIDLGMFPVETVQQISELQSAPVRGGEITIIRGLDRSRVFTDWIHTTFTKGAADDARQDITVTVMDLNKNPVKRIRLSRAWASDWHGQSRQGGADELATEAVTITYEGVEVENA
ncbi:phage tail protein [Nocardia sp. NPDC004604]|uniref:phage tail protein n=1 Tax=Nocardia sp. NPDC004604 TaxID=3157013 RepID=UPI0033BA4BDC